MGEFGTVRLATRSCCRDRDGRERAVVRGACHLVLSLVDRAVRAQRYKCTGELYVGCGHGIEVRAIVGVLPAVYALGIRVAVVSVASVRARVPPGAIAITWISDFDLE